MCGPQSTFMHLNLRKWLLDYDYSMHYSEIMHAVFHKSDVAVSPALTKILLIIEKCKFFRHPVI